MHISPTSAQDILARSRYSKRILIIITMNRINNSKYTVVFFLYLSIGILLFSCIYSQDDTPIAINIIPKDTLVFNEVYLIRDIEVDADGKLYVLDGADASIKIFDENGILLDILSRKGSGPGELISPRSLSINDHYIAVGESQGRISIFDKYGDYVNSFIATGLNHLNSNIRIFKEEYILIGGARQLGLFEYYLLHLYEISGTKLNEFYSFSETGKEYEADVTVGCYFDIDNNNNIYATQSTEYNVSVFNQDCELINEIAPNNPNYRPIQTAQPMDQNDFSKWINTWDHINRVFSINDTLLVVNIITDIGEEFMLDIIHINTGRIINSYILNKRLIYFDQYSNTLLFDHSDQYQTRIVRYNVSDLL